MDPHEASYNESKRAFDLFSIVLLDTDGEMDLNGGAKAHVVFEKGQVMDPWMPPRGAQPSAEDRARLFHHDPYTDRISFEMFYGNSDAYEYNMPDVSSSNKSIAQPKVVDYRSEEDEKSARFSVVYDCRIVSPTARTREVLVSVIVPVISGVSVYYSIRKTCGGGGHPFIEFGYYHDSADSTLGASRALFGSKPLVVGPHVMSTRIYLHLHRPAGSQEFFHPKVTTSSKTLSLTTRGPTFGGLLRAGESTVLHILYECRGKGKAPVSIKIGIAPFDPVRATWIKDCGGGNVRHLRIGSQSFEDANILSSGIVAEMWRVNLNHLAQAKSPARRAMVSFNATVLHKDIYLSNTGHPLQIGRPVFTVDHPNVLAVYALIPSSPYRQIFLAGTGDVLESDSSRKLRFLFVCKKAGVAKVLVTMPIKSFANVEFGFEKVCRSPKKHSHSGFLRTANSYMTVSTLFIIGGMIGWCYLQMRGKNSFVDMPVRPASVFSVDRI